ncbi:zinc finger protein 320-like [Anopheles albimanus]|uniref:zinc finger protein 320-like n=1 Tax=Anopheles albimanus TaxID=7167 RepID=UPI00163E44C0|nr:zinc finger protein 320-like [Anopheles albimanus]
MDEAVELFPIPSDEQLCSYHLVISKVIAILDSCVPKAIAGSGGCLLDVLHEPETCTIRICYGDGISKQEESPLEDAEDKEEQWLHGDDDEEELCEEVDEKVAEEVMEEILDGKLRMSPVENDDELLRLGSPKATDDGIETVMTDETEEVMITEEIIEESAEPTLIVGPPKYKCQYVGCPHTFQLAKQYASHQEKVHPWLIESKVELQCKYFSCEVRSDNIRQLHIHHAQHRTRKKSPKPQKSNDKTPKPIRGRCCEYCDIILEPNVHNYSQHCLMEHDRTPYNCPLCDSLFPLQSHLGQHLRMLHSPEQLEHLLSEQLWRRFTIDDQQLAECRFCYRVVCDRTCTLHAMRHRKELQQSCDRCGEAHPPAYCTLPKPVYGSSWAKKRCPECHRSLSTKNFKEHMATHTPERNFPCTVCKKTFKVRRNATRHIQNHINASNRKRRCYDCGHVCESDAILVDHYRAEHPELRPYRCPICEAGFHEKQLLAEHCHAHTDEERQMVAVKNPVVSYTVEDARVYECTLCRRVFTTKRATVAHTIVHTDRPHICALCSASFRTSSELTDHMKDMHQCYIERER